jgi:AraC-like DNA-binding protein
VADPSRPGLAASDTLSASVVRALVAESVRRGLDVGELRRRFAIPDEALRDVDARVGAELLVRLWAELPRLLGDDDFGLHLGESTAQTSLPFAARMYESCATVGEGLAKLGAFHRLLNDVHPTSVERGSELAHIRVRSKGTALPAPRHATEFVFAWMLCTTRRTTGVGFFPRRVRFEHGRPKDTREHQRVFGCPVDFDADCAEFTVASAVLDLRQQTADAALAEILESHARVLTERLPDRSTFTARVKAAIVPLLAAGASIEAVARAMRLSERSVQRYLQQDGTSFAEVLTDVRRRRAEAALRDTTASIATVAHSLGFSDQSAFHKAFTRWTATTPGAFRKGSGAR